jgi:curved DNA binding protein
LNICSRSTLDGKRKRAQSKEVRSRTRSRSAHGSVSVSRSRSSTVRTARGGEYSAPYDNFVELPDETIRDPVVRERYKLASGICNKVLQTLCDGCVSGASVKALCQKGDVMATEQALAHFAKPDEDGVVMDRGLAFPTCISVNSIVCHYHPTEDTADVFLKAGDVVRVELGVHIDGYIGTAAHTIIVDCKEGAAHDVQAQINVDVLAATYTAASAALRLMKPGGCNHEVTEMFRSVAHSYGVTPAQGVLSHRMKRWDEAGQQIILNGVVLEDNVYQQTVIFEPNQVWSLDVVLMNGGADNTLRVNARSGSDHCVFKRSEVVTSQRVRAARYVLTALRSQGNPSMLPFSLETFDSPLRARLGVSQLVKNQLVDTIPVLHCKPHQCVGRYKWTVLITEKGVERIAGLPPPPYVPVVTDRVTRDVAALLYESVKVKAAPREEPTDAKRLRRSVRKLQDADS